ncbi:hypothetical protein HanIR_Chr04g0166911 [Helianthus annuus]|nr:hypothetical protein HanIR_Chr04g0166911 [Helianthus annuus]
MLFEFFKKSFHQLETSFGSPCAYLSNLPPQHLAHLEQPPTQYPCLTRLSNIPLSQQSSK